MTKSEKQTRLDQFEIENKFGIWPDFELVKKARRASHALFDFDCLEAGGGEYTDGKGRKMSKRLKWFRTDGKECEAFEGEPHLMVEYVTRGKDGKLTRDNWHDCGKVIDRHLKACAIAAKLSAWFAKEGHPEVVAELTDFNCRYIKVTDGKDYYSLID